jgi:2,3-diketo-5-methylthiopentyl-1-phosphate enolase
MFDPIGFALPESIEYDDCLVATYLYQTAAHVNIQKAVRSIAETQSVGTWVNLSKTTDEIRRRHLGRVISLWEAPDFENSLPDEVTRRSWIFQVAYPVHNFGAQLPLMLTTAYGEVSAVENLKLLDLHFPRAYVEQFKGPKYGVQGIRDRLGVQERPLLLSIIKPPMGLTPEESAAEFYKSALGKTDIVKDDELLVSHQWSHFTERIREHQKAAQTVYEQTGHKILYFVNITDRPDRLVENAYRAIEAGASALMVNYLTVGISALSMLADDANIPVPIMAHLNFGGAIYASPWSGASSHLVLGKLPRLAGADLVVYPNPYGKFPLQISKYMRIAQALTCQMYDLPAIWPAPSGGVHPGMLPVLYEELGVDFILGAGGAIYGHPMGPTAGAIAFHQAIEATLAGIQLADAAKNLPELQAALSLWKVNQEGPEGPKRSLKGYGKVFRIG